MIIRGYKSLNGMEVNKDGRALGSVESMKHRFYENLTFKNSYSAVIGVTPTGAGDCFFYLKNDGDKLLTIHTLFVFAASAETIQVKWGDSGTVGGTHADLVPVSRHGGELVPIDVTCESGVDITGLSGGSIVDAIPCLAVPFEWDWESGIIIPKNVMLSLYAVTGAVAITATLGFHLHEDLGG